MAGSPKSQDELGNALDPATLAVVGGRPHGKGAPLSEPPVFASAFQTGGDLSYARDGNPTWIAFEAAVATLEGGGEAVAFASGMAAASAIATTLKPDARIVAAANAHVEVRSMFERLAAGSTVRLDIADIKDEEAFAARCAGADLIWVDSISNPCLEVADLDQVARAASEAGSALVIDSTLATPILQRPLDIGATAALHSASKYLGGHSDLLLGVVTTRDEALAKKLRAARSATGATPGTMETWLATRGLKTLALRIERGQSNARFLAERLRNHPVATKVLYPGIGAMVSFQVDGVARADAVCEAVQVMVHAGSLGGVESLIERHSRWHREPSVPEDLIRLSVGCEAPEDLWRDLERALDSCSRRTGASSDQGSAMRLPAQSGNALTKP